MVNMFQCIKKESLCIEVTTHCNCNCVQCFVQNRLSEHSDLSIDAVKTIIAEGFTLGFRQLHLTGGEPLLWNGLFEVIDFAFEKGYKTVTMNTNGSLLTAETTRRLAACKKAITRCRSIRPCRQRIWSAA